jgi:hypothetical protein
MIATKTNQDQQEFYVVHPLFDKPEDKCDPATLGRIQMSPSVKVSLMALRSYLIAMILLLVYHFLDLAGLFGHHLTK